MKKVDVTEAAQYFEGIFTIGPEGLVIVDHEGMILRVNPAFTNIFGYNEHEILGKPFDTLAYKNQKMQKITSHNSLHRFYCSGNASLEMTLFDKQGHDIPVRFRSVLIRDKHGKIKQAIGMVEHMVGLKGTGGGESSLAEKMWEAQQNFDNVLNNSADVIIMCDISGNIMMANKAFSQMLDYKQEDVRGKHIAEFTAFVEGTYATTTGEEVIIDEEYVTETASKPAELFERGYVSNWESYLVKKDNVHVPAEITMSVLKDKEGNRRGSVVIVRDITERKRAEREIKEARDYLENIIKTSLDGIMVTGTPKGEITMVNRALEVMLGYSEGELIGRTGANFTPDDEKCKKKGMEFVTKLFEEGFVNGSENIWKRKDGSLIDVERNAALLKDGEGNTIGAVASVRDITDRKKMELQLLQSEKLKSLGELAGGVAHDFNNVLAAILGRAQLLKMIVEPPPGKEEKRKSVFELKKGLEVIEQASLDGAETVRRIQEFARRRDEDKHFTTVDLNEIIDNALDFTRMKWKDDAESKGIKISIQKEFSTLPTTSGSASELREVFTNLINNSIDAMPQGGSIKMKTFKEDSHISIKVEDTGVGIPKTMRDRVFDPFFTTKGVQSSGLGLSVSYGIINRHRGTISADSIEGKGTTFTIKLPISEKVIETEQVKPIPEEQRKAKILVIEDEENVRDILSAILIEGGHQVETAIDGSQGIEMFEKKEFDLVFSDLGMPGMSGWQVAEKIKSINKNVPVAIITGWNVEQKESEMRESGVDLIVYKPFEVKQVFKLVQEGMILKDRFKAA
jgi:PAS domain S-box-containing protein